MTAATALPFEVSTSYLRECFAGLRLYGDDFKPEHVERWVADEEEAYARLVGADRGRAYEYSYDAVNRLHGYRWLPQIPFPRVLGLGSAYGHDLEPIADRVTEFSIVEPATGFWRPAVAGVPARYAKPTLTGRLPFPSDWFNLAVSLGTLHHIPNVSTVIGEVYRCLAPGGYVVLREPTISLGNWTRPRPGLTRHERGIPLSLFDRLVRTTGFEVVKRTRCLFGITPLLNRLSTRPVHQYRAFLQVDRLLCALFWWNTRYHAEHQWQKLRPTAVYYVLRKP